MFSAALLSESANNIGLLYNLSSMICLYPSVCFRNFGEKIFKTPHGLNSVIHQSSVNAIPEGAEYDNALLEKPYGFFGFRMAIFKSDWLSRKAVEAIGGTKWVTKLTLLRTGEISILAFILFCDKVVEDADDSADSVLTVLVDSWLKMRLSRENWACIRLLRYRLFRSLYNHACFDSVIFNAKMQDDNDKCIILVANLLK